MQSSLAILMDDCINTRCVKHACEAISDYTVLKLALAGVVSLCCMISSLYSFLGVTCSYIILSRPCCETPLSWMRSKYRLVSN